MEAGVADAGSTLWKSLPILIVNGATLLVVVVMMIRTNAKTQERLSNGLTATITALTDAVNKLNTTVGLMTERVSRIEGKIEGIALSRAPEMADTRGDITGVNEIPRGFEEFANDAVTPINPTRRPTPPPRPSTAGGRVTPAVGVARIPTPKPR